MTSVLSVAGTDNPRNNDANRRKFVVAGDSLSHLAIKPIGNLTDVRVIATPRNPTQLSRLGARMKA
jgi:hypothetical protein